MGVIPWPPLLPPNFFYSFGVQFYAPSLPFSLSCYLIRVLSPLGTSIKFYGRLGGGGGSLQFRLDGRNLERSSNGTNFADGPTPVFTALNLEDGDHQLFVYVISLQQNGTVAVDYFEYVPPYSTSSQESCSNNHLVSVLRIRLDGASTFSGQGQTRRMYQKKRSLSTILARILCSPIHLSGATSIMFSSTSGVCPTRTPLVHR